MRRGVGAPAWRARVRARSAQWANAGAATLRSSRPRGVELADSGSGGANALRRVIARLRLRALSTNDKLQLALAALWLVDAGLQFQPAMFTGRFAREVIAPAAEGQPDFVAAPIRLATHVILWAPGPMNAVFAAVQLAIGVGLLFRRSVRPALIASVMWSLNVWYLGEGLGGLAGGKAMLLTGAPGAVLLYGVLAVAVWPNRARPAAWLQPVWVWLWLGGAALQITAGGGAVRDAVGGAAAAAPAWMRSIDHALLSTLPRSGLSTLMVLAAVQAWVGLSALAGRRFRRIALGTGIVLSLAFWVFGESLGTYWTGLATDPNSGPVLVLAALAVLGTAATEPSWRLGGVLQRSRLRGRQVAAVATAGLFLVTVRAALEATQVGRESSPTGTRAAGPPAAALATQARQRLVAARLVAFEPPSASPAGVRTSPRNAARAPAASSAPVAAPSRLALRRRSDGSAPYQRPARPSSSTPQQARAADASPGPVHRLGQITGRTAGQLPPPPGSAARQGVNQVLNTLPPNA